MKRKVFLKILTCFMTLSFFALFFFACQNSTHVCSFTVQSTTEKHLKTPASCEKGEIYYYSCSCGNNGVKTFEAGTPLGHTYGDWFANDDGTHTKTCLNDSSHKKTESCTNPLATCIKKEECTVCSSKQGVYGNHVFANAKCTVCDCDEGLLYQLIDGREYQVKEVSSSLCESIVIPTSYNGKPVTSIGEYAFYNCLLLVEVTIPETITRIERCAFYSCLLLSKVNLPKEMEILGNGAFANCVSLQSVNIPKEMEILGDGAFSNCESLQSVNIPKTLIDIGKNAFSNCASLTNIQVDANNPKYQSIEGNLFSKDGKILFQYAIGKTTSTFTVPSCVNVIESQAFCGSRFLTDIVLSDNLIHVGDSAFSGCVNLKYKVYDGLKYLGSTTNEKLYLLGVESKNLTTANVAKECKFIGSNVFWRCYSLTEVNIPNGVVSIGGDAFYDCYSLSSITLPNSLIHIGAFAFYNCKSTLFTKFLDGKYLPSENNRYFALIELDDNKKTVLKIHDKTQLIAEDVFFNGNKSNSIIIPKSVLNISNGAFIHCEYLERIYYVGSIQDWLKVKKDEETFLNKEIYYYVENRNDLPNDDGNYWHYDEKGNPIIW